MNHRRPLIQTAFRHNATSWVLQHVDALNGAYDLVSGTNQKNLDPILLVDTPTGPSALCHVQHGSLRIACPVQSESEIYFMSFMN